MKGEVLGDRYQIEQQLGKRAGRRTLLARDNQTQELVVVKLLSFSSDFEWEALKLFEREAETLKTISHTSIPRYLDFFELDLPTGKGFALVQTYVEGKSLEEHLKAGRTFSEDEVKQLAKDLLEILIYLHGRQPPVIHRDIKPSNILLTNRSGNSVGEVYLVDFGSVQTLAAKEGGTITVVGTYGYMPPEQFGDRAVPSSDLYSLGATLITLVTGTHPADLPHKDGRIQFEKACNPSPAFSRWLRWMIEPSLDRRFASAPVALQALEKPPEEPEIAPLVVSKPTGSKVSLKKDNDYLEILLHPEGFKFNLVFLYCVDLFVAVVLFSAFSASIPWMSQFFFLVLILPLWRTLFALFRRVRLRLDQRQISLIYEIFGIKFKYPSSASKQDINKLEVKYVDQVRQKIIIWVGTQKYELGGNGIISEPELDWLAYELSDWLGLPINVRK